MSKYVAFPEISFKDSGLLLAALADLGYNQVDDGEALPLFGYAGDQRPETAEIVVRRRHLGAASNDLGFARGPRGYTPIISEYDQRTLHGGRFLAALRTTYSERVVEEVRRRLHGTARRTIEGSRSRRRLVDTLAAVTSVCPPKPSVVMLLRTRYSIARPKRISQLSRCGLAAAPPGSGSSSKNAK